MPTTLSDYNVQCLHGHVWRPDKGSELEARCIDREKCGYLDALTVSTTECGECAAEESERARTFYDFEALWPEVLGLEDEHVG